MAEQAAAEEAALRAGRGRRSRPHDGRTATEPARREPEATRQMKLDVITLDGERRQARSSSTTRSSASSRAPTSCTAWCAGSWPSARQGTHTVLGKSEVSYSTKKIYRQKGTGGARHGSRKAPIFRHGGTYKGPTPRSHAHDLTKKFRALGPEARAVGQGRRPASSIVHRRGDAGRGQDQGCSPQAAEGPRLEARAGHRRRRGERELRPAPPATSTALDVLPSVGANVYDILRRDKLVLTKAGVEALEARLK